ncbi:hypothetical protein O6H91_11G054200 [Diphasiastrum complanatum]|uniref:Uncharacterized protein n=1 Tax=Diphasiastrum complanatum TaxID=34168 RepID=A0ACC2C978_DIPCM|nr:hypothetical protein O6H91_11G054200 [Diphasiastrum complanatum]
MAQSQGMAFAAPSASRSSASSKVQLWRPAKEVLQFLTECALPSPALALLESGSGSLLSESSSNQSLDASIDVKRAPPARWEPPVQMKVNLAPAGCADQTDGVASPQGRMDYVNLSTGTQISHQSLSGSNGMTSQLAPSQNSMPIDCGLPLHGSSAAGSSKMGESSILDSYESPKVDLAVCEAAPTTKCPETVSMPELTQEHASNAASKSVGLMENAKRVDSSAGIPGESKDAASEKDHPEPLDLLMNAIQVASGSSSATQKPVAVEKEVEAEKAVHHHSLGLQKVAYFVHGSVPIAQKRVRRRAKSSYKKSHNVRKEEKELIASNTVSETSLRKEQSPENEWFIGRDGKQAIPQERSLESILYGDAGPPIRSKRGRSQTLSSQYRDKVVSSTYKRSRSKSFKCATKIWTFA